MQYISTLVYIVATLSLVKATSNSTRLARFEKNSSLNDLTCSADENLFSEEVESKLQCTLTCIEYKTCYTIFYTEITGLCYGCNTIYSHSNANGLTPASGNVHYQIYPSCGHGWTGYMRSCYKLSTHAWFFIGAAECTSEGGHAVYIETSVENEFLKDFIKTDTSTWAWYIGITECAESGVWKYFGSEDLVQFTDFRVLSESNSCCALFFDGYDHQWAQFGCENPDFGFPTVCEKTVV